MHNNILLNLILLTFYLSTVHAETFSELRLPANRRALYSNNTLFVSEVYINSEIFINGVLHLENDGTYRIGGLTKLGTEEMMLAKKISSIPCGVADTLGRFSAYRYFMAERNYCLVKVRLTTVEGGQVLSYLFIENGTAEVITDYRDDIFGGDTYLTVSVYDDIEFGFIDKDVFFKENSLNNINDEHSYVLMLYGNGVEEIY